MGNIDFIPFSFFQIVRNCFVYTEKKTAESNWLHKVIKDCQSIIRHTKKTSCYFKSYELELRTK